jgi:hypothetical protein
VTSGFRAFATTYDHDPPAGAWDMTAAHLPGELDGPSEVDRSPLTPGGGEGLIPELRAEGRDLGVAPGSIHQRHRYADRLS